MRFVISKTGKVERPAGSARAAAGAAPAAASTPASDPHAAAPHPALRGLWEEHVAWTRLMIVSTMAGLPDLEATTRRLLRSAEELGAAFAPCCGEGVAGRLAGLLRAHVLGAGVVLAAARERDEARLEDARQGWQANADEIAATLGHAAAGRLAAGDLRARVRQALDLTLAEAIEQREGRHGRSVERHDRLREAVLELAERLGEGLRPAAEPS